MKPEQSCRNWLTIIGPARTVARFAGKEAWAKALQARHIEWLELTPGHHVCEFTTTGRPLDKLEKLSRPWPALIFVLDYECGRSMGLVKAWKGQIEGCEISY
jgi:hypothetical protein